MRCDKQTEAIARVVDVADDVMVIVSPASSSSKSLDILLSLSVEQKSKMNKYIPRCLYRTQQGGQLDSNRAPH